MAKTKISEFSSTPGNNTDIDSINLAEGCAPSGINDAIRELMAQLKDFQTGAVGDSFNGPVGTTTAAAGAFTTLTASSTATLNTLVSSGATLTGGTINGMAIGGTTAAAVSATTLTTSSTVTLNGGTANGVAYLNGSKVLTTGSALTFDGTNFAAAGVVKGSGGARFEGAGSLSGTGVGAEIFASGGITYYGSYDRTGAAYAPTIYVAGSYQAWNVSGERMRITSTGNVGIGTSSPAYKLDVVGVIRSNSGIKSITASGGQPEFVLDQSGVASWTIYNPPSSTALRFYNGVDRMTLDSSGNLGLGVTPSAWDSSLFKVAQIGVTGAFISGRANAVNQAQFGLNTYYDGAYKYVANGNATRYEQNTGAHYWYTAPSGTAGNAISFSQVMTLDASGNLGVGVTNPSAYGARLVSKGTTSGIFTDDTNYTFAIKSGGSGVSLIGGEAGNALALQSGGTERARIDSSGRLNVNRTTGGGTVNIKSQTNSFISEFYHYSNDASVGSITTSTTATTYGTSSDYRLKNVIGPVADAGSRIDALEPVEYEWKSDGSRTRGFLAHKFQEVYAGSVTGSKDAVDVEGKPVYQAMQAGSSEVIADLVAEIKSLRQRLAAAGI